MKTIEDLTPEVRAKIKEYKELCTKDLYSGEEYKNFNRKNSVDYIEKMYELAKQKKPVVIFAKNPIQYKLFFELINKNLKFIHFIWQLKNKEKLENKNKQLRSELYSELSSELYSELYRELDSELYRELDSELNSELDSELSSELDSELYRELDSELSSELYSELSSELYSELYSELRSELDSELYRELDSELSSELRSELDSELYSELYRELRRNKIRSHWLIEISVYSRAYFSWYRFINKELNVNYKREDLLEEIYLNSLNNNIARCYFTKMFCLVLRVPKKIIRNENSIHSIDEPAIQFDGYDVHYVRGIRITDEMFKKLSNKEYTFEDFVKEPNEEIKNCALAFMEEKWGSSYLFDFLSSNLTEIDTFTDKKDSVYLEGTTKGMNIGVYTLFKGSVNDAELAFVRCYCPSTDRMFFLGVDSSHTNPKDAIASLYRVPRKLVNEIKSISRQGEIFSTSFKCDTSVIESLSDEELSDLVGLKGDEYFKLIRYEY